jgi:hypothetical protein
MIRDRARARRPSKKADTTAFGINIIVGYHPEDENEAIPASFDKEIV